MNAGVALSKLQFWLRCCAALEICVKEALLNILHDQRIGGLPKDKQKLHGVLLNFKQNKQKRLKNIVRDDQWEILCHECDGKCPQPCPRFERTDSNDFDVPLIVLLIIQCTILSNIKTNESGEKMKHAKLSRQLRNEIMHRCSVILQTEQQFVSVWQRIRDILNGLGYTKMKLFEDLKTQSLDQPVFTDIKDKMIKTKCEELDLGMDAINGNKNHAEDECSNEDKLTFKEMREEFDYLKDMIGKNEDEEYKEKIGSLDRRIQKLEKTFLNRKTLQSLSTKLKKAHGVNYGKEEIKLVRAPSLLHYDKPIDRTDIITDVVLINNTDATVFHTGSKVKDGDSIAMIREKQKDFECHMKISYQGLAEANDKFVLITGAPGIGKTTLLRTLLHKWASNELWSEEPSKFHFVFLISLKELKRFQNVPDLTVERIFEFFYPDHLEIMRNEEANCLLLLDGFDELPGREELNSNDCYSEAVKELCNPKSQQLPMKTRIMTTRPDSYPLLKKTILSASCTLKYVEVVGFSDDNIRNYVEKHLQHRKNGKLLMEDILNCCPEIFHMMHVPFNTWAMCYLLQLFSQDQTPATFTKIYLNLFLLYLYKQGFRKTETPKEILVSPEVYRIFCDLAKFAYEMEKHRTVNFAPVDQLNKMQIKELKELEKKSGMLIQIDFGNSVKYQFLNYSFHELLVAFHIVSSGELLVKASNMILRLVAGFIGDSVSKFDLFPINNNLVVYENVASGAGKPVEDEDILLASSKHINNKIYVTIGDILNYMYELQRNPILLNDNITLVWHWPSKTRNGFTDSLSRRKYHELLGGAALQVGTSLLCITDDIEYVLLDVLLQNYKEKDVVLYTDEGNFHKTVKTSEGILNYGVACNFSSVVLLGTRSQFLLAPCYFNRTKELGFVIGRPLDNILKKFIDIKSKADRTRKLTIYLAQGSNAWLSAKEIVDVIVQRKKVFEKCDKLIISFCEYPRKKYDLQHWHDKECISKMNWTRMENTMKELEMRKHDHGIKLRNYFDVGVSCLQNPLTASKVYHSRVGFNEWNTTLIGETFAW